jgi:quercetin dioxygenase-like cupin family protein
LTGGLNAADKEADMKTTISMMTAAAILTGGSLVMRAQTQAHMTQSLKEAQWGPAPPVLPPGAQIAVLAGDPGKPAPYTVRLKFPANYAIPAHSHPTDENVVVTSGAVSFGMGDELKKDAATNKTVAVGGYFLASANMNHYAYTTAESTIVLYGVGPVEFKYVKASDDPRNANKGTK